MAINEFVITQGTQGPSGPRGLTGDSGPQGVQGEKGDTGSQGVIGLTGPQGATGSQGPTGTTGATGPAGVSSAVAVTAITSALLPTPVNLFDYTKAIAGFGIDSTTGLPAVLSGYHSSSFIAVYGAAQLTSNIRLFSYTPLKWGLAFYDQNQAYLSGLSSNVDYPLNTPIAIPAGAYFVRVCWKDTELAADVVTIDKTMIVTGATLPVSFSAFGYTSPTDVASSIEAATTAFSPVGSNTVDALSHPTVNIFDFNRALPNTVISGTTGLPVALTGYTSTGFMFVYRASQVVCNCITASSGTTGIPYGIAFYDAVHNLISAIGQSTGGNPIGTPITVPSGAYYMRAFIQNGYIPSAGISRVMFVTGANLPTTYVPFANAQLTPFTGKNFYACGDSITSGVGSTTGLYSYAQALANLVGGNYIGRNATNGIDAGRFFTSGSLGSNVAPVSADFASVDYLFVFLGTNQYCTSIGTVADAPVNDSTGAASFCSQVRYAIETLLDFNPKMRLIWVIPYQNGNANTVTTPTGPIHTAGSGVAIMNVTSRQIYQAVHDALVSCCGYYAIPYIDLWQQSGINAITTASFLSASDYIHPTQTGYDNMLIPALMRGLLRFARG